MKTENLLLQQEIMSTMATADRYATSFLLECLQRNGFAVTEQILKENLLELLLLGRVRNFGTFWKNAEHLSPPGSEEHENDLFILCPHCNSFLPIMQEYINQQAQCEECMTEFMILATKIDKNQHHTQIL